MSPLLIDLKPPSRLLVPAFRMFGYFGRRSFIPEWHPNRYDAPWYQDEEWFEECDA